MLALLPVGALAVYGEHTPAFLWGRSGVGLHDGGDYLHEVSGAELQKTVTGLARGAGAQPLVSSSKEKPEVLTIFLHDELATDDVRALGSNAFPHMQKLMKDSPASLSVPFTTRTGPLRFDGATTVPADQAEQFMDRSPTWAKNGKTDIMLVNLPTGSRGGFAEHDEFVSRVTASVHKATGGNYVALMTGKSARSADFAMRRQLLETEKTAVRQPWLAPGLRPPTDLRAVMLRSRFLTRRPPAPPAQTGLHISPMLMSAEIVVFLLFIIFINGFCCLFQLQTPKKFDEVKAS
jgi:hypothetical protein